MASLTSRQFSQNPSGAKRAAADGPVFITEDGRPTHVLMTIGDYRRLAEPEQSEGSGRKPADLLQSSTRRQTPRPPDLD